MESDVHHTKHIPVMAQRIDQLLAESIDAVDTAAERPPVLIDATLGLAGHAELFLKNHPRLVLVGFDRDPAALERSRTRLAPYASRTHYIHATYDEIPAALDDLGMDRVDAALFDLGVSSMQLDDSDRGFAYSHDGPLDMRMNPTIGISAEEVVNTYSVGALTRILREYGEERFANRIANAIATARSKARLESSAELAELVRAAIPAATRRTGGHPAKRTFQSLRIEVNQELEVLRAAIPAALDALAVGGRIAVLSYHSLEDRIVKRELTARCTSTTPPDFPVEPDPPEFRMITRGAELPDEAEMASNPRAQSAKLRVAERVRETR